MGCSPRAAGQPERCTVQATVRANETVNEDLAAVAIA